MLAHARQAVGQDRDARGGESESAEEDVVEADYEIVDEEK